MFSITQLKFASISEAKIAAQSLCELLKSRITAFNLGVQVTVGKVGTWLLVLGLTRLVND